MNALQKLGKNIFYIPILFLIVFVAFGVYTYFRLQKQILDVNLNRLLIISQSQEMRLNSFFDGLRFKFKSLQLSPTLRTNLKLSSQPKNQISKEILSEFFKNYFDNYGLARLVIYNFKGEVVFNYSQDESIGNYLVKNIDWKNYKTDSVYLSDLFYDFQLKKPAFKAEMIMSENDGNSFLIEAEFDARKSLYNILETNIYQSSEIESNLVQVKDGVMTFISDSKYLGDIAFRLQSQISLINNGKQLKKGKESFIEGIDYRGEPVYAYINYLPKFNWFLIVKSDQNQAIKELSKFYYGIFGTILGATFIFIIAMTGIVKKEKEKFLREADQLRKQKELIKKQYEYIAKIANDAIIITDSQNRIIDYNDKFLQLYNIDSPQNLSLNFLDFVSDNLKNQWNDCLRNIKENDGLIFEAVHKTASGETFNVQVSARFIELEGNEFLIQIVRDFEERKRIEDELRSAKHKAEESDRLKSNFLSMMSHEVRTPINIILGAVDLLKSNLNQEIFQQNEHLFDMITRNGKRLLTLISDIIDISRIESNELKLEFMIRNVESLILDVISEYEQVARKKGLQIITNFKAQNPYARIDEVRFIQIISNLINNAIKFTSQGGITVITENVGESIHISVKDTGIGIPEQALKDIFKMFRQAHEGYGRNFEGAGLGLTITQKLTKMMGGEIKVESQVNVGSTFTVIFPAIKSEELDENLLRTLEERHKNSYKPFILIVNNDKDEAFYLESLMIRLGFEYLTINEGKKIISVIKHKPADCIIYSVNLQNETETEKVMEEIRKKAKLENLKIIALRSPDTIISEWRLKEIGFNLVKTKPISFEDISKILYQVLSIKN